MYSPATSAPTSWSIANHRAPSDTATTVAPNPATDSTTKPSARIADSSARFSTGTNGSDYRGAMRSRLARLVPPRKAGRWRNARGPMRILAHRGDSAHVTENTVAAFAAAVAAGADGVEL